jgi:hypothetical protein
MKPLSVTVLLVFLGAAVATGDDQSDRQKLMGSWELPGTAESGATSNWTFSEQGNSIHVTHLEGGTKVADFNCAINGSSCEVKEGGKKATMSMWFNGPKLVQMETKGSEVVKRRFAIVSQGDAAGGVMEMEIFPLVPDGKTETVRFKRTQLSAPRN